MARLSPLQVYKFLPGENCKKCGEDTCMAFASALIERKKKVEDCTLFEDAKYAEKKKALVELMTPPVREVQIGRGKRAVTIGGEKVMYRHELTYFNQTGFFIDVHDEMNEKELLERMEDVERFSMVRIGKELRLDGVAVRSKSNDATKFGSAVLKAVEKFDLPIILCSFNPELLQVGLEIAAEKKPLLYAATKENWEAVAKIASTRECSVVASSPGDVQGLLDLVQNLLGSGVTNLVLDIGSHAKGRGFYEMMENLAMLRRMAVEKEMKILGFPIIGVPAAARLDEKDELRAGFSEAVLAASQLLRFCDALILHSMEAWELLPLLTLRQSIYTDPRFPTSVEPGLKEVGKPDENSPTFMTSNFALTYYTVAGDLESSKLSCYVLVVNTEGLAVEVSMAGGKLTAAGVKSAIETYKVGEKVKHRKLIIPGRAARISGEIEDATGWKVLVGPIDSSQIAKYISESWKPD